MGKGERESADKKKPASDGLGGGFLDKLLGLFFGANDPEKEKKRILKDVGNSLKKSRYKFYNLKNEQALPGLAKVFYDIYKIIGSAQAILRNAESSNALKAIILEAQLTKEQLALKESFSEESIREKLKTGIDTQKLAAAVKNDLLSFLAVFDAGVTQKINTMYGIFAIFHAFAMYDYYFVLKKFDSAFPEKNFTYTPKFEAINGEYIVEELKDFIDVIIPLDKSADWDGLFTTLKQYKEVEIVNRAAWKKLMTLMVDLKSSNIFELLIRYIGRDPFFKAEYVLSNERIIDPYVAQVKSQTEAAIRNILQEKRNQKTDQLVKAIFGAKEIIRMKNYAEKINVTFTKKLEGGFLYLDAADYMKTFMIDYVKKDMKSLCDLMVVRGKWVTNLLSQQVADTLQKILATSDSLLKLDEACADDGAFGMKIKKALPRAERDAAALRMLRDAVNDANKRMMSIIIEAAQILIGFGKTLKSLIDDYDAPENQRQLVINWKEVDNATEGTIKQNMTDLYKKIYYFIQLMQVYVKPEGSAE
ncbi:MAG: hypothetical protein LBQ57_13465 [Spirochaetales bacterium]|jgi:hypothetical protein|nr:hypothetical protein [Spirochaetales bacterium]